MKSLLPILSCLIIIGLSSCNQHIVLIRKTPAMAQCIARCTKQFEACKTLCDNNCRICSGKSTYSSNKNYNKYVKEQAIQGKAVNRELQSYRDPLQCLKISCNCLADVDACNQACTGIVRKQLRATPLPDCE